MNLQRFLTCKCLLVLTLGLVYSPFAHGQSIYPEWKGGKGAWDVESHWEVDITDLLLGDFDFYPDETLPPPLLNKPEFVRISGNGSEARIAAGDSTIRISSLIIESGAAVHVDPLNTLEINSPSILGTGIIDVGGSLWIHRSGNVIATATSGILTVNGSGAVVLQGGELGSSLNLLLNLSADRLTGYGDVEAIVVNASADFHANQENTVLKLEALNNFKSSGDVIAEAKNAVVRISPKNLFDNSGVMIARNGGQVLVNGTDFEGGGSSASNEGRVTFLNSKVEDNDAVVTGNGLVELQGAGRFHNGSFTVVDGGLVQLSGSQSIVNSNFQSGGSPEGAIQIIDGHHTMGGGIINSTLAHVKKGRADFLGLNLANELGEFRVDAEGVVNILQPSTIQNGLLSGAGYIASESPTSIIADKTLKVQDLRFIINGAGPTTIKGHIDNNGRFEIKDRVTRLGNRAQIILDEKVSFTGEGEIKFMSHGINLENQILGAESSDIFHNGPKHSLTSADGAVGYLNANTENEGEIDASNGIIFLENPITNKGILKSSGPNARLDVDRIEIQNEEGIISAENGGTTQIYSEAKIVGGQFGGQNGGVIYTFNNIYLDSVGTGEEPIGMTFNEGAFFKMGGPSVSTVHLNGDINLNGIIQLDNRVRRTSGIPRVTLLLENSLEMKGTGELQFSSPQSNRVLSDGKILTLSEDIRVTTLPDSVGAFGTEVVNNANIVPSAGILEFYEPVENQNNMTADEVGRIKLIKTVLDNTEGMIGVKKSGVMEFVSDSTVIGGTFTGDGNGRFLSAGHTILDATQGMKFESGARYYLSANNSSGRTTLKGDLNNDGQILLNNNDHRSQVRAQLFLDGEIEINGNGKITFSGTSLNEIRPANNNPTSLTIGKNQTIEILSKGNGGISVPLINNGRITSNGGNLNIEKSIDNNGVMQSFAGGFIKIASGIAIENEGGTILIGTGTHAFQGAPGGSLNGGIISLYPNNESGEMITFGDYTLNNVTIGEGIVYLPGGSFSGSTFLEQGLINNGEIRISNPDSNTSKNVTLWVSGEMEISGDGSIEFATKMANRIRTTSPDTTLLTIGKDQDIVAQNGSGQIDTRVILLGDYLISNDGGIQQLRDLTNKGNIKVGINSTLGFGQNTSLFTESGRLELDQGQIQLAHNTELINTHVEGHGRMNIFGDPVLNNVIIDPDIVVNASAANSSILTVKNGIENNGTIILANRDSNISKSNNIRSDQPQMISGNGTIHVNSKGANRIFGQDIDSNILTIGEEQKILIDNGRLDIQVRSQLDGDIEIKETGSLYVQKRMRQKGIIDVLPESTLRIDRNAEFIAESDAKILLDSSQMVLEAGSNAHNASVAGKGSVILNPSSTIENSKLDSEITTYVTTAGWGDVAMNGTIHNDGFIAINHSGRRGTRLILFANKPLVLNGKGRLVFGTPHANYIASRETTGVKITVGEKHSIEAINGNGRVEIESDLKGSLKISDSGIMTFTKPVNNSGNFEIEQGGRLNTESTFQSTSGVGVVNGVWDTRGVQFEGGTIKGDGQIIATSQSQFKNTTLSPGDTVGSLTLTGPCELGENSKLLIELAQSEGTWVSDKLLLSQSFNINGDLIVDINGNPEDLKGQSFEIVKNGNPATPIDGSFTNLSQGSRVVTRNRSGSFKVSMTSDSVVLSDFQTENLLPFDLSDALSDPDGNGLSTIAEWFFGTTQRTILNDSKSMKGSELNLLGLDSVFDDELEYPVFTFKIRKSDLPVKLQLEASEVVPFSPSTELKILELQRSDLDEDFSLVDYVVWKEIGEQPDEIYLRLLLDFSDLN